MLYFTRSQQQYIYHSKKSVKFNIIRGWFDKKVIFYEFRAKHFLKSRENRLSGSTSHPPNLMGLFCRNQQYNK